MKKSIEIFFCYAREDQQRLKNLKIHLMPLLRLKQIRIRYDVDISPGTAWEEEIDKHLNTAELILLLVSPDFIASDYCYGREMKLAMERHERGEARVIPIILRPVNWMSTPLGKLQALPTHGKPISRWRDRDEAFFDVAEGIRKAIGELLSPSEKEAVRLAVGIGSDAKYELQQKFIGYPEIRPLQPNNSEDLTDYIQWGDEIDETEKENMLKLKPKQKLQTESGMTCEVQEFLGRGGQGEVYRVSLAGKPMALKWYYPHFATPEQRQILEVLVKKGPPAERFLWPLELVRIPDVAEFGYLMPLREPRYKSIVDLMMRRVATTFRCLTTAGYQLADSYFQLHMSGLCYRDISFGNIFLEPTNGNVLICDNDNVTVDGQTLGGVLGTSRFMAPEIVLGETIPSTKTDLFSLSVLLFYMFMFHHPLEGKKEADIHVLDAAAMARIYGSEPVFIFDPNDHTNEPVPGYQNNPLIFWPIYPQFLRDLFTRAFTDGIRDPVNSRVRENEWRAAMVRLRDSIFYCPHCKAENFYDVDAINKSGGEPTPCWKCNKAVQLPFRLRINDIIIMLNYDTKLFPHHIDRQRRYDFSQPVAEVARHPKDPDIWGLKNISQEKWVLMKQDGSKQDVDAGRSATLTVGIRINFGSREGKVY